MHQSGEGFGTELHWMATHTPSAPADLLMLEGQMASGPTKQQAVPDGMIAEQMDTLDEPIMETLLRDLRGIAEKIKHVILPTSKSVAYRSVLKDWDLWGPLLTCTFFCLSLNHDPAADNYSGPHFAEIFLLLCLAFYAVGINFKLLATSSRRRGQTSLAPPSIFQLICVFGYCLSGPCLGIIVVKVLQLVFDAGMKHLFYEKLLIGLGCGFLWPTWSALRILSRFQSKEKQMLAAYPIALLYFVVSWFIISAH